MFLCSGRLRLAARYLTYSDVSVNAVHLQGLEGPRFSLTSVCAKLPAKQCNIPEDRNPQHHLYGNFKIRN